MIYIYETRFGTQKLRKNASVKSYGNPY